MIATVQSSAPLLLIILLSSADLGFTQTSQKFSRDDFPSGFVFGAGTSAYQVEGAAAEDGRTPSIWDTFTHQGRMPDKSTADVSADGYHKYKEDVKLMADTGLEAYRFSISWSRILPNGRGAVNTKGLKFYNDLINELIKHGIQPHITIYHLDLPQVLEDEYGGWLSPKIVDDFKEYADVCFREFGNRVSHWTTIIEPNVIGMASYGTGLFPPGRCSRPFGFDCSAGNSTTEPYIVVHNILLAHAAVVNLYRTKYQVAQNGKIGLNIASQGYYPYSNSSADVEAMKKARDFLIGWIINPIVFGDYPTIMKKNLGQKLPSFTKSQAEKVKGSFDFIGLNHYVSLYVKGNPDGPTIGLRDFSSDMSAVFLATKSETLSGQLGPTVILNDPPGLQQMLGYLQQDYGNPPIYIHENGYGLLTKKSKFPLNDTDRINYLNGHIGSMLEAIRNGSNVRGYFVWSFIDVFEILSGYQSTMGLYYVDFEDDDRRRQPKLSAHWYSNFLKKKRLISTQRAGPQRFPYSDQ